MMTAKSARTALYALCLAMLMVVLDTTIVTVALPSIVTDLHVVGASATWAMNAYTLAFGGTLLLSGRLADLYGRRRFLRVGIVAFTVASVVCGMARTSTLFFLGRALQGLGGSAITSVSLSLIISLFVHPKERAGAMGAYGFVCAVGGGAGEILGGALTNALSWHWIFMVNVPIGLAILMIVGRIVPDDRPDRAIERLDVAGAVSATATFVLIAYTLVGSGQSARSLMSTALLSSAAGVLLLGFVLLERRLAAPLIPLNLFRMRDFVTTNVLGVFWSSATSVWFLVCALYLQRILAYSPLQVGLAFMPATILVAVISGGLAGRIVSQFGTKVPLCIGLLLVSGGLAFLARAPVGGFFLIDVLPAMFLLGLGGGIASTPLLLASMNCLSPEQSGLASGVINTSLMMGGALGLALLASLADLHTAQLLNSGVGETEALNEGYHLAFGAASAFTVASAAIAAFMLKNNGVVNQSEGLTANDQRGRQNA